MRLLLALLLTMGLTTSGWTQYNAWYPASEGDLSTARQQTRYSHPSVFETYRLDHSMMVSVLQRAPHERTVSAQHSPLVVSLPAPDGTLRDFGMVTYDMMSEELAAAHPHIRHYIGVDPVTGSKAHCTVTGDKFFAAVRSAGMTYYIDPYSAEDPQHYVIYDVTKDQSSSVQFSCDQHALVDNEVVDTDHDHHLGDHTGLAALKRGDPISLHTYRLAITADHTFVELNGGTEASTMDVMNVMVARINSVYENDVAIRFIFTHASIHPDEATDPFRGVPVADQSGFWSITRMILNNEIGLNGYDIGHNFNGKSNSTSGQGIASLASACDNNRKAFGASGMRSGGPNTDRFAVGIVSHEIGHQFDGQHTMYHCQNVNLSTSYEPGSGTTIMAYAGICGSAQNVTNNTDPYFHTNSIQEILNFSRSSNGSCAQVINMGNTVPDVEALDPDQLHIPVGTPFRLRAAASDMESDAGLTFCWEQYQTGSRDWQDPNSGNWDINQPIGTEPLFRSYPPTPDSVRFFPSLPIIVNNSTFKWEQLPSYERLMVFRVTARDNVADGGGASWDSYRFNTHDPGIPGAFEITNFDVRETINSLSEVTLTWDVWNTDQPPVSTPYMDVYMSADGGMTFPYLLKSATPNDGSTTLQIPNIEADRARFMIVGHDQIFLDISNRSATIERDSTEEVVKLMYQDQFLNVCAPDVIDIELSSESLLGTFSGNIALGVEGLPAGVTYRFSNDNPAIGEDVVLTIDFRNAVSSSTDDLVITYTPDGLPMQTAQMEMNVRFNSFDDLILTSPARDAQISTIFPEFTWEASNQAVSYRIQIATDPTFDAGVIVDEASDVDGTSYQVIDALDPGQVYYWRVIPNNDCGEFILGDVNVFLITPTNCQEFCSTEPSIAIASAANTYSMTINLGQEITPEDVNITKIRGRHTNFGHLRMSVQGPGGNDVWLLGPNVCSFSNTTLDMGFDDESAGVSFTCNNFDDGLRFKPREELSAFNGIAGNEYTLTIEDNTNGGTGTWDGWCIELCGELAFTPPSLITNETLQTDAFVNRVIPTTNLEVTHPDYAANELIFTVVSSTEGGDLLLEGSAMGTGSQFSMQDIIDGRLSYTHTTSGVDDDGFDFIVTAPNNGVLFTPRFNIRISSATNNQLPQGDELILFPNPTTDQLTVRLQSSDLAMDGIYLFDAVGHLVNQIDASEQSEMTLPMANLPAGIYLVQVTAEDYVITRKVIKL